MMNALGGPLSIIDDTHSALAELSQTLKSVRARLPETFDAVARIEHNVDRITDYVPWIIGAISFLGVAIITNAIVTYKR
jgi:hypothetical protein